MMWGVAAVVLATACDDARPPAGMGPPGPQPASRPAAPASTSSIVFTDVSATSGIDTVQTNGDPDGKWTILESLGQGAAVLDANGDGRLDVFLPNGGTFRGKPEGVATPRSALWLGAEKPFTFTKAPAGFGLDLEGWFQGAYAADVDGDRRTDLFLTGWKTTRLLLNRGDRFEDATATWGAAIDGWTSGAVFFDADGDLDLDLFVARYVVFDAEALPNGGKPCDWRGIAVACGPHGLVAETDVFLRNVGGRFEDATKAFGFDRVPPRYGLGVVTIDIDGDGDLDLYVANDSQPNDLWENRGGTFVNVADKLGCDLGEGGRPQAGMGVDCGDLDLDGRPDLVVTNFEHDTNTLYLNRIGGRVAAFLDAGSISGFSPPSFPDLAWGIRIADFDRNGRPDVLIANGHIYPQVDGTALETSYRQPMLLLEHLGNGGDGLPRFGASRRGAFLGTPRCGRGLLLADFDDDGDDDALMTVLDGKPALGRNDTPGGSWIGFVLEGSVPNTDAIGATIEVTLDDGRVVKARRDSGGGFYSTSDPRTRIGIGTGKPTSVCVRFPGGRIVALPKVETDCYVRVNADTGTALPIRRP